MVEIKTGRRSSLTEQDQERIWDLSQQPKIEYCEIAELYGVSTKTIQRVVRRKHLQRGYIAPHQADLAQEAQIKYLESRLNQVQEFLECLLSSGTLTSELREWAKELQK